MKEFTLLITVLFNFISGEHQEIHLEIQQDSLSDCQSELEEMNEIGISFFGNRVDVMIECIVSSQNLLTKRITNMITNFKTNPLRRNIYYDTNEKKCRTP